MDRMDGTPISSHSSSHLQLRRSPEESHVLQSPTIPVRTALDYPSLRLALTMRASAVRLALLQASCLKLLVRRLPMFHSLLVRLTVLTDGTPALSHSTLQLQLRRSLEALRGTSIPDYTGPDSETTTSASTTCTDNAGLTSLGASPSFMFEATGSAAPTVSLSPGSPNGENGWYTSSVSFLITPPSETISGGVTCTSIPDYTGPDGTGLSFTSTCTDNAGLTNSAGTSPTFKFEAYPTIGFSLPSFD